MPLSAIYLLEWGELGLRRLTGARALRRVVEAATYRGELLEPMGLVAAHWERCARLVQQVPVWEWMRPCDWAAIEEALGLLNAHLRREDQQTL